MHLNFSSVLVLQTADSNPTAPSKTLICLKMNIKTETTVKPHHPIAGTRIQEQKKLRFPQKLWILVNDGNQIIDWSRNGTTIVIDIDALDAYLQSELTIFRMQSHWQFERQLVLYGFQRLSGHSYVMSKSNLTVHNEELVKEHKEFRHDAFKQDRPSLVDGIRKCSITKDRYLGVYNLRNNCISMDPCRRVLASKSSRTPLDYSRQHLRMILQQKCVQAILDSKMKECEDTKNWSIALEEGMYENARESVSGFEQTDVAGFYGKDVTTDEVKSFFGALYVPTYYNENASNAVLPKEDTLEKNAEQSEPFVEPFAIPQFHIVPNECVNSVNPYSLQMVGDTEANASGTDSMCTIDSSNQLLPIHYDISFMNAAAESDSSKTEFNYINSVDPHQVAAISGNGGDPNNAKTGIESAIKDEEEEFAINQFFIMRPKDGSTVNEQPATMSSMDSMQKVTDQNARASTNERVNEANETIQEAALIDDDFFLQIRESMEVLYDKILC